MAHIVILTVPGGAGQLVADLPGELDVQVIEPGRIVATFEGHALPPSVEYVLDNHGWVEEYGTALPDTASPTGYIWADWDPYTQAWRPLLGLAPQAA
jgi:hypothetical protein